MLEDYQEIAEPDKQGPFAISTSAAVDHPITLGATPSGRIRAAHGSLELLVGSSDVWTVRVSDPQGAVVQCRSGKGPVGASLATAGLSRGIYLVRVTVNGATGAATVLLGR
jgi:hypothetical protein